MIKIGLIGAGKMGISHLSILGAHPSVEVVGVTDTSKIVLDVLRKYSRFPVFSDFKEMLNSTEMDAVVVSVPTKFHSPMVAEALAKGIAVFAEKPLCLTSGEAQALVKLADAKKVVNQVGYHNKFVATFNEVKRLLDGNCIGKVLHFSGESYGPVVTRVKSDTWRSDPSEGGGCLMDYASHVIDLLNYLAGPIVTVKGSILKSFYSKNVEDSVYSMLQTQSDLTGTLSVNWSDETYRKMSTTVTFMGSAGKIVCDANELKVFFGTRSVPSGYDKGWNLKYVTDLTPSVDFYLRGEEYSAQLDYFIKAVRNEVPNTINTFSSAWQTDHVIQLIKESTTLQHG